MVPNYVQEVLSRFSGVREVRPSPGMVRQWKARCPAHDDRNPSLSIGLTHDGKIVIKDFAGCTLEAILHATGLTEADLFPPHEEWRDRILRNRTSRRSCPATKQSAQGTNHRGTEMLQSCQYNFRPAGAERVYPTAEAAIAELVKERGKPSAQWEYRNAADEVIGLVLRWDTPDGKDIRPVSLHPEGWKRGAMPTPRPLYRLPEVLRAELVIVTEGEKAADAAYDLGLVATTSSSGAKAAKQTDWTPMRGRYVLILPDHDEAGEQYATEVASLCHQAGAASIKILRLADHAQSLPEGGDLADVLTSRDFCGLSLGDAAEPADLAQWLLRTAESLPLWQPSPAAAEQTKGAEQAVEESKTEAEKPPSVTDVLVSIGRRYELWRDDSDNVYAVCGRASVSVRSQHFQARLAKTYYEQIQKTPSPEALNNAVKMLQGLALLTRPVDVPHVRAARSGERVYVDLADEADTIIEIDCNGWRPCSHPPVRFVRRRGMRPLPMPERGGNLTEFRELINCPDDDAWTLLAAWMTAAMSGTSPYPVLVLTGEQGSAKSTTARMLKELLDPADVMLRSEPRETRDLMIAAAKQHILAFDNLSALPGWLSDCFCRLATGGGFATRELYTDDEEVVYHAVKPVILNGVTDFVTRPDLLERSLVIRHPPIPEDQRRTESELRARFEAIRPRLLGALFDRIAGMLRCQGDVKLPRLPRMADFAVAAVAAERGAGEPPRFLTAYGAAQAAAEAEVLETDPVGAALLRWVPQVRDWTGSASELLAALSEQVNEAEQKGRGWPSTPRGLVSILKRLAPALRRVGIRYEAAGWVGKGNEKRAAHRLYWSEALVAGSGPTTGSVPTVSSIANGCRMLS